MAQRAGDAQARDLVVRVDGGLHADDGAELEQRDGGGRVFQVDGVEDAGRQHLRIDLQPDRQRGVRGHGFDDVVHP